MWRGVPVCAFSVGSVGLGIIMGVVILIERR